ncbi:MAG: hypothetical protein NWR12_02220, partial [Haliea sp.]|nr:hypothetical protein [Haliea sp.]
MQIVCASRAGSTPCVAAVPAAGGLCYCRAAARSRCAALSSPPNPGPPATRLKKNIFFFFSGSRAEYNIQFPLLKLFQNNKNYKFYFIVAGSHTSNVVGDTFKE